MIDTDDVVSIDGKELVWPGVAGQHQHRLSFSEAGLQVLGAHLGRLHLLEDRLQLDGALAAVLASREVTSARVHAELPLDRITVADGELVISLGEVHAEHDVLKLSPGHVDLQFAGKLSLRLAHDSTQRLVRCSLWLAPRDGQNETSIRVGIDLVIFEQQQLPFTFRLPVEFAATPSQQGWSRARLSLEQRALTFGLKLSGDTRILAFELRLGASEVLIGLPDFVAKGATASTRFANMLLRQLEGPLIRGMSDALRDAELLATQLTVDLLDDVLLVRGIELHLNGPNGAIQFGKAELRLDKKLRLARSVDGPELGLSLELLASVDIAPAALGVSLVLHKDCRYELELAGGLFELRAKRERGEPVASAYIPRLSDDACTKVREDWRFDGPGVANRFVLDVGVDGGNEGTEARPAIKIGPGGVELRAQARPRALQLGCLRDVVVADGSLELRGRRWALTVGATATLPWIAGASGRVEVRGGSGMAKLSFGAVFIMAVAGSWTDPSGVLRFCDPSIMVAVNWEQAKDEWKLGGALSGALEFGRAAFERHAAEWVSDIFSGLRVEFEGLKLDELDELDSLRDKVSIPLKLSSKLRCALWDVLTFDVRGLRLFCTGLGFEGDISFALGPLRLGGRLPDLRVRLRKSRIELDTESSGELAMFASLEFPSGVRGKFDIRRKFRSGVTMLEGTGTLSMPSFPDASVFVAIGRFDRKGRRVPTIAIYGEISTMVVLLPGVIIRRVGLGLGVYRSLHRVAELDGKDSEQLLAMLAKGTPISPASGEEWQQDPDTLLSLVARGMASASTRPEKDIDFYAADVLFTLDTRLRFTGWMNAWLLTSIEDARSNDHIRSRPYARGAFSFDVHRPSIVAGYQTLPDARSSLAERAGGMSRLVAQLSSNARTSMRFEADPRKLFLQLGPHRYQESIGSLGSIKSSSTMIVRVDRGRGALMSMSTDWSAGMSGGFSGTIGPVEFGVEASAGFSLGLMLGGGLHKSANGPVELTLYGSGSGEVSFGVSAWGRIRIEIRFRIKLGPFKTGFRVSIQTSHVSLSLSVGAKLGLELMLGSSGVGFEARATLTVKIAMITASGTIRASHNSGVLDGARQLVRGMT